LWFQWSFKGGGCTDEEDSEKRKSIPRNQKGKFYTTRIEAIPAVYSSFWDRRVSILETRVGQNTDFNK